MIYIGYTNYEEKNAKYNDKVLDTEERWKRIKINNQKTHYFISNLGRLKNKKTGKINDFSGNKAARYIQFSIMFNDKEYKFSLHRLVAEYFCEIPKRHKEKGLSYSDLVPNHKDGIKHHNASFNLEWVTPKENTSHAWKTGLCDSIRGENNHLATISEETAIKICDLIMEKKTNNDIINELKDQNVTPKIVQHIRSGECWKHITSKYNFPKLSEAKHYTTPENTIHKICKLLETTDLSASKIAEICGVKREYVKDIKTHRRRKDISQYYNF